MWKGAKRLQQPNHEDKTQNSKPSLTFLTKRGTTNLLAPPPTHKKDKGPPICSKRISILERKDVEMTFQGLIFFSLVCKSLKRCIVTHMCSENAKSTFTSVRCRLLLHFCPCETAELSGVSHVCLHSTITS